MKLLAAVALLSVALVSTGSPRIDAPTGFDNKSNGMVDEATRVTATRKLLLKSGDFTNYYGGAAGQ